MEGYYRLLSTNTNKVIGYVSFELCRNKEGRCYSVKCKVDETCDCLFLRISDEGDNIKEVVLRRFIPEPQGTFVYFSIDKPQIDDFLSQASDCKGRVYACVSFNGNPVGKCVLKEKEGSASFDPFGTVNKNYKWFAVQNIDYLRGQGLIFSDAFKTVAERGFAAYRHLLAGQYFSEEGIFTVIGVPDNRSRRAYEYGRWVNAKIRYMDQSYTGYWLFYFDDISKKMVRPVIRINRRRR